MTIAAYPSSTQKRLATPVSDIMTPGVITIGESASLLQAKRAMVRHGADTAGQGACSEPTGAAGGG